MATDIAQPIAEKRPLLQMQKASEAVIELLRPACERIEVAGSIRRSAPWCKDIEIVCVPRMGTQQSGLFDTEETNELDGLVATLLGSSLSARLDKLGRPAMGPRYKRLLFNWGHGINVPVDLFAVLPPAQWGVIMTIRTGPAEFSHRLVTPKVQGGMLPSGMHVQYGYLVWDSRGGPIEGRPISTPEEIDVFGHLGIDWIEPWDRK